MQPSRPHSSTGDTQSHVPRSLPSSSFLSSGSAPGHSQTILPSIRQLHPYLPPAGIPAPMALSEGQTHFPGPRGGDVGYALHESEPDELEQQGPPKKKRRRQALSCTECKRRKIKCDRSQPCAPCTRRGEQAKCHWHVVEPVEKYVTRQEFDDLKTRFDELATLVHQYMPLNSPARQLSRHHMLPGPSTPEAMHSYHLGYPVYQPAPPPVQAYHHSGSLSASPQVPPPPPIQRHERIGSPHLRSPIGAHVTSTASPPLNLRSRSPLSSSLRHRVTDSMESTTNTIVSGNINSNIDMSRPPRPPSAASPLPKGSLPHSLASITSPYVVPEPQSKNCLAQMLNLGERLRTPNVNPKGPAVTLLARPAIHALFPLLALLPLPCITALFLGVVQVTLRGVSHHQQDHHLLMRTLAVPH